MTGAISPISQMRKQRLKEVKELVQDHTDHSKQRSRCSDPGLSTAKACLVNSRAFPGVRSRMHSEEEAGVMIKT